MPPPMPPMREEPKPKVAPPTGLRDVPRFLRELVGGFFSRLGYTFRMVWKSGPWILISMVFIAVFEGVMPVVGSLLSRNILNGLQDVIEEVAGGRTVVFWGSAVMVGLILYFSYRILHSVVTNFSSAVSRIAGEKVVRYVRLTIMHKAREVDLASFDLPAFYEKLENANREAGTRPISTIQDTFDTLSKLISLVSYLVILATAPGLWWIAPVLLAVSIPSAIINFRYRRKNWRYLRGRSKERRQMAYYSDLVVNKDMVKEVRLYDLDDEMETRFENAFDGYYHGIRRLILRENAWHVALAVLTSVVNCFCYGLVALEVFGGVIRIGDYSLFTGALTSVHTEVSGLIRDSARVYEGTLFIDNLISFLEEKRTIVPTVPEPRKVAHGEPHTLTFSHVTFRYPGTERDVLSDVSFTLRPGETCVLVGLNGAGKTTLIKLLTRLYDPSSGVITLDGHDIREYDVRDLYRMFGIIFQDFGKYAVTVSDNVRFGDIRREADADAVREAAREADAVDYIEKLPAGFDTPLMRYFEPNGIELSGGQWQKLSIARAFYSNSDFLILDEPTASLDPMAEQEIFNQFDRLRKDKTTIFVSHRLSSATVASKILVLEYGRLVEEGTHRELMAKNGRYATLFNTQAKRYIESAEELGDEEKRPRGNRRPHADSPAFEPEDDRSSDLF